MKADTKITPDATAKLAQTARVWLGQAFASQYDAERSPGDVGYLAQKARYALREMFLAMNRPDIADHWTDYQPTDGVAVMEVLRRLKVAEAALERIATAKPEPVVEGFVRGPAILWGWAQREARQAVAVIRAPYAERADASASAPHTPEP